MTRILFSLLLCVVFLAVPSGTAHAEPAPVITGISLSSGIQGHSYDITITGTGFINSWSAVRFVRNISIIFDSATWVNSTTITGHFTIPSGQMTGLYALYIDNMGGSSRSLPNAFTVLAASSDKAITGFAIPGQVGPTVIGLDTHNITLRMPYGTDVTALVPTITIIGESVSPASGVANNFTNPVIYKVTATDASTLDYTVTVTVALNPAKAITAFNIPGQVGPTAINEGTHMIALTIPYGTDVTALVPTITIIGESVNPGSGVANNFTTPQTYTVTATDASTLAYTVTVTISSPPPPLPNPLIGTGTPTSYGSSLTGTVTMTQPISLPIIQTQGANLSAFIVTPGTPVTVTADIANKGTVNGTKKVTLYVNGQVESTQGVTVNSGSSSKLIFSVTRSEPGVYSVSVDGVSAGRFKVDDFADPNIILYISMALIFFSFIFGSFFILRRKQNRY